MNRLCPRCSTPARDGAPFCASCGAPIPAAVVAPPSPTKAAGPPVWVWIVLTAVITALVAAVTGLLMASWRGGDEPTAAGPTVSASEPDQSSDRADTHADGQAATGSRRATKKRTAPRHIGDAADLRSGLFCRDLNATGYSYSAAVEYWRLEGHTNRMDADRNGIPCETVYSRSDVVSYWGDAGWSEPGYTHIDDMPGGLLCKDLAERGYSYGDAVTYWFREGAPDRMDADLNGIPCETVYPSYVVDDYWGL